MEYNRTLSTGFGKWNCFTIWMCIVVIIAGITTVYGPPSCPQGLERHTSEEGISRCCSVTQCPAGSRPVLCQEGQSAQCQMCSDDAFMPSPTLSVRMHSCIPHRKCPPWEGLTVLHPGTSVRNTECACARDAGFCSSPKNEQRCVPCVTSTGGATPTLTTVVNVTTTGTPQQHAVHKLKTWLPCVLTAAVLAAVFVYWLRKRRRGGNEEEAPYRPILMWPVQVAGVPNENEHPEPVAGVPNENEHPEPVAGVPNENEHPEPVAGVPNENEHPGPVAGVPNLNAIFRQDEGL